MTLAEALLQRVHLINQMADLKTRAERSARVQDGTTPIENPLALVERHAQTLAAWSSLLCRINFANLTAALPDGTTLTEALARRDALTTEVVFLRDLAETAVSIPDTFTHSEVRWLPAIDVVALCDRRDDRSRELRVLQAAIQSTNWSTTLD